MKERAGYLLQASPSNKDVMDAMAEVEARHEALAANTRKNIEELEWMTDNLSAHQELYATHQEWQKDMWEKLHSQTGEQGLRGGGYTFKNCSEENMCSLSQRHRLHHNQIEFQKICIHQNCYPIKTHLPLPVSSLQTIQATRGCCSSASTASPSSKTPRATGVT